MDDSALQQLFTLARLAPREGEFAVVREQLTGILEMAKGVQGAHTGALVQNAGEFRNVMREDEPKHEPGTYTERIVAQFPDREGNYLAVHQVITGGKHTESH